MSDATVPDDDLVSRLSRRLDEVDTTVYELVFYGFLFVWVVGLMVSAWGWSWDNKLVPMFAGIPTIAFLLVKLVAIVSPETYARVMPDSSGGESEAADESDDLEDTYQSIREQGDDTRPRPEQISYALRMVVWAVALPLMMYLIGFANALPLFIFLFGLRYYDSLRMTVVVTVSFSVVMYLFFWLIIGLDPWPGILGIPSIVEIFGLG